MVANIWIAASDNSIKQVEDYINGGQFTANSKDPNGYTPIHAAASYGHIELLKLLIAKGGDINIQDNDGDTPLHHCEDLETAKLMVEQFKCDWKLKNGEGQTALEYKKEDEEFPELVAYLETVKYGTSGPKETQTQSQDLPVDPQVLESLPTPGNVDGREVKYTLETEDSGEVDSERRKQIEEIMKGDNAEEKLREYVTNVVQEGMTNWEQEQDQDQTSKRRKE